MGGNALKNTQTRRYQRDEYYALETEVLYALRSAFPARIMDAIPAYAGKESFGDMDILLESDNMTVKVRDVLEATFSPTEIIKNGNCYSFDYKQLQIDLILTPIEVFNTSLVYFSYNDLGNLMGRIYHQMGLKYGHEGLTYAVYDDTDTNDTRCLDVITVSRNHTLIFSIAGYSYERWLKGFKNLEEIFEFAVDTPYFNYGIFDLENRNHRSRIRDRKRQTYTKFLEWAKDKPARYDWGDMSDYADRKAFLPRINQFFPDFQAKYDAVMEAARLRKHIKSLYNGERISELTGLREKELGMFMAFLKKNVTQLEEIASVMPREDHHEYTFAWMVKIHTRTTRRKR
jgi:hypothetical protein